MHGCYGVLREENPGYWCLYDRIHWNRNDGGHRDHCGIPRWEERPDQRPQDNQLWHRYSQGKSNLGQDGLIIINFFSHAQREVAVISENYLIWVWSHNLIPQTQTHSPTPLLSPLYSPLHTLSSHTQTRGKVCDYGYHARKKINLFEC